MLSTRTAAEGSEVDTPRKTFGVCLGHFRNTERYEISRNNFFPYYWGHLHRKWGYKCFNLALFICALSCVHLQSVPWTMRLILQKAPAKFFRLWTAKSWGPVPCMGGTWWLRVGQLYWQPSSSHLRRSPGGSTLGFRERHVTQGSSLENKVTQGVRVLSEEQKIGKTLNTRATRAETERAFIGELEAEETRLAQKLLWVVIECQASDPLLLVWQDLGKCISHWASLQYLKFCKAQWIRVLL